MSPRQTTIRRTTSTNKDTRACFDGVLNLIFDFFALRRSVKRPHNHTLFQAVTNAELLHLADQLRDELIVDPVKKIKPLDCQTGLAAIEESTNRCGAHGLVDIRVVADDHGVTASKFQSYAFDTLCRDLHDMFPGGSGSRETDFAYTRILQQRFAHDPTRAGNNIEHAGRQPGFMENVDDLNVRERRGSRRFDHDGVSSNQRRSNLITKQ